MFKKKTNISFKTQPKTQYIKKIVFNEIQCLGIKSSELVGSVLIVWLVIDFTARFVSLNKFNHLVIEI